MRYPALDIRGLDPDLAIALVDEYAPTAVEDLADGISVFFTSDERRNAALAALGASAPDASLTARDVDDEDWARRSQQNLTPVTVGRMTVTPPWFSDEGTPGRADMVRLVILPSMGFGTGHHATTRLCLAALQTLDLSGRRVLDVGTGSGVLAMAAVALGASEALGVDVDPDAIQSANESLALNPGLSGVRFAVADLKDAALAPADIVFANLTGAVLVLHAAALRALVRDGGRLVVSGLQVHERTAVEQAFLDDALEWAGEDGGWVGLVFAAL